MLTWQMILANAAVSAVMAMANISSAPTVLVLVAVLPAPVFNSLTDLNDAVMAITIGGHQAAAGRGDPHPIILLIGEALGENEERERKPFVGAAGRALDGMLAEAGLINIPTYITNVVKIRPTEVRDGRIMNRPPTDEEIEYWGNWLTKEIELLDPKIIVGLGVVAASYLFALPREQIIMRKLHGDDDLDVFLRTGKPYHMMVTYHPAATLYNPDLRTVVINDLRLLRSNLMLRNL